MAQVYQSFSPSSVTHVLASRTNTLQYKLRTAPPKPGTRQLDVINLSWLLECGKHDALITLHPRHFLFLSSETLNNVPGVDAFGDPCVALILACMQVGKLGACPQGFHVMLGVPGTEVVSTMVEINAQNLGVEKSGFPYCLLGCLML